MKIKRSRKPQQQAFEFFKKQVSKNFGGQALLNKRKSKRPLSIRAPIHFVIRINSESDYRFWIRELTSEIVRLISVKTGINLTSFFTLRPWTRILNWGRDYKNVMEYLILNKMEVVGLRPAKKSNSRLSNKRMDPI